MKKVSMSGSPRENVGKKDAKKNRAAGQVPCVLYGGKEQVHFTTDERSLAKILFTPDVFVVNLTIGGNEHNVILQDVQYHPVTDKVLHADFLEVISGKAVKIALPVKINGSAPGVMKGGKLIQSMRKLKVHGLTENLPDEIEVDVSGLEIGNSVKISDLKISDVELLDRPSEVVVAVKVTRAATEEVAEEEEAGEEAAEAEKAGEGKEEKE